MPVSEKTKRIIWAKSAGKCSICKEELLLGGESDELTYLVGEVAHIVAEKSEGPRGKSNLSLEERNSESHI